MSEPVVRRTTITADDIRAYSRRGNYHSDAETAREIGLPGLVAQGVHVAGAAYAMLLEAWGEDFLARGEIDLRFVGIVLAGDDLETSVTLESDAAAVEVQNTTKQHCAVVGRATRVAS